MTETIRFDQQLKFNCDFYKGLQKMASKNRSVSKKNLFNYLIYGYIGIHFSNKISVLTFIWKTLGSLFIFVLFYHYYKSYLY